LLFEAFAEHCHRLNDNETQLGVIRAGYRYRSTQPAALQNVASVAGLMITAEVR